MGSLIVGTLLIVLGSATVFEALALVAVAMIKGRTGVGTPYGAGPQLGIWTKLVEAVATVLKALGQLPAYTILLLFGYGAIAAGCYLLAARPF